MFRGKVTVPEKGKITVPGYCPVLYPLSSHTLPLSPDPSPPPGRIQGMLQGRYDHGADPGEIPKTEHCRAASCADFVATFPRPFRGSSTPPLCREIAAISGHLSDPVSYIEHSGIGRWDEHHNGIRLHFRSGNGGVSLQIWERFWHRKTLRCPPGSSPGSERFSLFLLLVVSCSFCLRFSFAQGQLFCSFQGHRGCPLT